MRRHAKHRRIDRSVVHEIIELDDASQRSNQALTQSSGTRPGYWPVPDGQSPALAHGRYCMRNGGRAHSGRCE
jgi:hypothetical protein